MSRLAKIHTLNDRIESIGLTRAERQAIIDLLIDGKSHREAGGGNRRASMKRMERARRKARAHGIEIPAPRASLTPVTLAHYNERGKL